jgi:hypothetical protein
MERPEPRGRGDRRVERRDRAARDGVVEVTADQRDEPDVQLLLLLPERGARADAFDQEQPGHRPVTGERGQDRAQRDIGARDRIRLARDGALDAGDELVRRRPHELQEQRLLGREVEVEAALRRLRLLRDLVHGRITEPQPREHVHRCVQDPFASLPAAFLCHLEVIRTRPTSRITPSSIRRCVGGWGVPWRTPREDST